MKENHFKGFPFHRILRASLTKALLIAIVISFFQFSVPFHQEALGASSVNVPLGDWAYDALEKLAGFGLLNSDLKGTKPYTRMEVARLVLEAIQEKEKASFKKLPALPEHFLERFQRDYRDELAKLGFGDGSTAKTFFKPIDEVETRYVVVDGERRKFEGFPLSQGQIKANEGTPLVTNNEGIAYGEHNNGSLQFSSSMVLVDTFSGYVQPIFLARQNSGNLPDFDAVKADILKGYLKLSPWNIEIEAGRDSLWWGQGNHGTLILTNNAAPLDMVKVSNPRPFLLPWIFEYLGPFKYSFFLAELESDRDFPNALLGGVRLNFKPTQNFEMGASRTFIFGGQGASNSSFMDYLKLLTFTNPGGTSTDTSDSIAAFDFRWRFPCLRNAELYVEWGGEDTGLKPHVKEFFLQDLGYIIGLYFPRLTEDGRTDLRIEYADNVSERARSFWYGHNIYGSGYTYKGFIMGHSMGPDAREIFARTTHYLRNDLLIGLDLSYKERGGGTLDFILEQNYQLGTDVTFDITDSISVKARYACEEVRNFNLVAGDNRLNNLFIAQLNYRF